MRRSAFCCSLPGQGSTPTPAAQTKRHTHTHTHTHTLAHNTSRCALPNARHTSAAEPFRRRFLHSPHISGHVCVITDGSGGLVYDQIVGAHAQGERRFTLVQAQGRHHQNV